MAVVSMKVHVVSKKFIKPCTPTPQNLNKYEISLTDELSPPLNVGVLLFYSSKPKRISHLEESLAKILVEFYPLAGRYIKRDHLVDCSGEGAEFVEAEAVDVELIDLVGKAKAEQLNDLLPRQCYQVDEAAMDPPLLSIQVTEFNCGGLVIGISVFHKIFDASSIGTFISAWSNVNYNPGRKITISPIFNSSSLFPGKNLDYTPNTEPPPIWDLDICVKRFLFPKEAITSLRSKLKPNDGKEGPRTTISRVRVVCAVIAKAMMGADRAKYGKSRPCLIIQAVNMRERTIPPLPKHSCGNFAIPSLTRNMTETETKEMGIQELVYLIGDGLDKTIADCAMILSLGRDDRHSILMDPWANLTEKSIMSGEVNVVMFSDWSKFGFYEADFGWGKPVWTSIGPVPGENTTALMDNKEGDGIEAWVYLKPNDMAYFEQDEDIKLLTA